MKPAAGDTIPHTFPSTTPRAVVACGIFAVAVTAIIPLVIVPSFYHPFRQPKLLVFHAAGICLIGAMAIQAVLGLVPVSSLIRRRMPDLLVLAIVVWTLITAAFAVHGMTALFALLTALSAAALFFALRSSARWLRTSVLLAVVLPATVNAALTIVQELKLWNEIAPASVRGLHAGTTALLGNPNYIGNSLAPALIVALAWAIATTSTRLRLSLVPAILLIAAGIVASRTRGAILGALAGIAVLCLIRWRTAGLVRVVAAASLVVALILCLSIPMAERIIETPIQELVTGRLIAFAAAFQMFLDSPLLGVGPGCFEHAYFDNAAKVYPSILNYTIAGRQHMFGEVHNDHLQIAAETGLIGYLLFIGALATVTAVSRRQTANALSERGRFSYFCAAPLAASLAALGLFQFPLYLTTPLTAYVFTASLVIGWWEDETVNT